MRTLEGAGVLFGSATGPAVVDAAGVLFGQATGPAVVDAAAVTFQTEPYPDVRVMLYMGNSTGWQPFALRTGSLESAGALLSMPVHVDQYGNTGARNYWSTGAPDLWDFDLMVVGPTVGSSDAALIRAQCDEAEISFISHIAFVSQHHTNSTFSNAGVAEAMGLVSTAGSGSFQASNSLANGYNNTWLSTHPSHSFSAGDPALYSDEAAGVLSTGSVFVGAGFGWHTSTQGVPALGSTEAHYCYSAIVEGTTDYSTGGVIRRRSMMWGGGLDYIGASTGSVRINADAIYWLLSTGPLVPFVGTLWDARSVQIDVGGFRHLSTARSHSATRYQVDYSTGDWTTPLLETGWSTNLYSYYSTGYDPAQSYKVRVAFLDDNGGESRWSAGLSEVSAPVSAEAGIRVQYLTSTGGLLRTDEYWTTSAAYVERVVENVQAPSGTDTVRLTPLKQGTADAGVCAKEVYVESGAIAAGYHPAPFFPARDTDEIIDATHINTGVSSSNALTIDWAEARHQSHELTENVTYTFANLGIGTYHLRLVQDTPARTITWPGAVQWGSGAPPVVAVAAGEYLITLVSLDGTDIVGAAFASNVS